MTCSRNTGMKISQVNAHARKSTNFTHKFLWEKFKSPRESQAKFSKLKISYKKVSPGEKSFSHRKLKIS